MKSRFDIGAVTFFFPGLSSLYLYLKTKGGIEHFSSTGVLGRGFVAFSHILVSIHHMIGVYMAITVGEEVYRRYFTFCMAFTFMWLISARVSWILITNTLEYRAEDYEYDALYDYEDEDEEDFYEEEEDYDDKEEGDFYDSSPRIRRPYA